MAMSSKKEQKHTIKDTTQVDENMLFTCIRNHRKPQIPRHHACQSRNNFNVLGSRTTH